MDHCTRDGLVFDVRDDGPASGEAVVLLHGWPQDHTAWQRVTPLLHAAGLRTLAPDQRGYSRGARPSRPTAYGMRELVADVVALLDQAGVDRAHLVGHDWGGSVAWAVAERHPERLRSLTVLSTPHHRAMAWAVRHGDQGLRSLYTVAFQLPVLPELVLHAGLPLVLRRSGLPAEDVHRYAARFREPGAATAGLNWYRALPLRRGLGRLVRAALPGGHGRRNAAELGSFAATPHLRADHLRVGQRRPRPRSGRCREDGAVRRLGLPVRRARRRALAARDPAPAGGRGDHRPGQLRQVSTLTGWWRARRSGAMLSQWHLLDGPRTTRRAQQRRSTGSSSVLA